MVGKDCHGVYKVYQDLIFHGGPGAVVEMRVFSEAHLLSLLDRAGFSGVTTMSSPDLEFGYYWPDGTDRSDIGHPSLNYIITAQA